MALAPGTRLGAYEILTQLGAGGMGDVYRAKDTKLGREVALKILPATFTSDPDRVARFRREAQVLASLNHPHIGAIYGLDEADGHQFLVLELVDGESLDKRIARKRIPVDEALAIAKQIAEALEAAHEKGIIHRDLKPANIALTKDGNVKVLDFGLAKATENASGSTFDVTNSPTITTPAMMTGVGMILGTAAYMSPEQAKGRPADKRSDIWAFGCVLYEMLTAKRAFDGEDVADTLASVLRGHPDWSLLPAGVSAGIRTAIVRCVERDRTARIADLSVIRFVLDEPTAPMAATHTSHAAWRWLALTTALVAAAVGVTRMVTRSRSDSVVRLHIAVPPGSVVSPGAPVLAISPDGKHVAFRAGPHPSNQGPLYIRSLDHFEPIAIPNSTSAQAPFFSPDGEWVAFVAGGKLRRVAITGGAPIDICDVSAAGSGGAWGPDGTIIFGSLAADLMRVPASGGKPELFATPHSGERRYRFPSFLPDGQHVLFAITRDNGGWDDAQIAVRSITTGEQHTVFDGGTRHVYVPTGHLLVERAGTILAVPFDLKRLRTVGSPVPVIEHVMNSPTTGTAQFDVSASGTLLYLEGTTDIPTRTPTWVTRQGSETSLPLSRPITELSLSPDGKRVAFAIAEKTSNIWIYDVERGSLIRATSGNGADGSPRWTPDGGRLAFTTTRNGPYEIFSVAPDRQGSEEQIVKTDSPGQFPRSWSPDGKTLLFSRGTGASSNDLWVWTAGASPREHPVVATPANETQARFSPDGRWLAFQSNESGRDEVYVQPFPGPGGRTLVSTNGGQRPLWRGDGRELYYRSGTSVVAVDLTPGQIFHAGIPRVLFQGMFDADYDVTRDGQRFLMLKGLPQSQPTELNVVLNWSEELKARVPTK